MKSFFSNPDRAVVMVVEPSSSLRFATVDAVRSFGFETVTGVATMADLFSVIEVESVDWVLAGLGMDEKINALHLLKLFTEESRFRRSRISLLLKDDEHFVLPLAFELGMLSYHTRLLPSSLLREVTGLIRTLKEVHWDTTLAAAEMLRVYLNDQRLYPQVAKLTRSLLELYPGSADLLLQLGEAQLLSGQRKQGLATIGQVRLLSGRHTDRANEISSRYSQVEGFEETESGSPEADSNPTNVFGIEKVLVVDPDGAVQYSIKQLLTSAGVPDVLTFSSGREAWDWIEQGGRPDLIIQEWRLTELAGPLFLQRVRNRNLVSVPIIVMSSLLAEDDLPLLTEMGVSATVKKPVESQEFFAEVIHVIQQNRAPTEQLSFERKIRQLIHSGNIPEAKRLASQCMDNPEYGEEMKLTIGAEFAFSEGNYQKARDLGFMAFRMSNDSMNLLNLLGKSLIKLGDFESAMKCFDKANALAPENIDRLCKMAIIQLDTGNVETAEKTLAAAKSIDAGNEMVKETEANIALSLGDTERAATAMAESDSLTRIMAYMNNKAVALVRCSRLEDGINLYRCTIAALPGAWSHSHEVVCYNLALAYIRYGELEPAINELARIIIDPGSPLGKKAKSLRRKAEKAIAGGTVLSLETGKSNQEGAEIMVAAGLEIATDAASEAASAAAAKAALELDLENDQKEFLAILSSIAPNRGDIGCFRLFFAGELLDPKSISLLNNPPFHRKRESIKREETMKVKSGT